MPESIVINPQARELQARAREIADRVLRPQAARCDRLREPQREAHQALVEAGLYRVFVPEEHGGAGAGTLALCLVTEELAKADSGFAVSYAARALATLPILLAGTEAQKARWLPAIARGELTPAFCLSEKGAGSDLGSLRTTAERDGTGYLLRGEKKWTTNGAEADLLIVFCVTDPTSASRRLSAFAVESDTPGFSVGKREETLGLRSVSVTETRFDEVRVSADHLLGGREGRGFQLAMATLDRARPGVAAQAVGAAQGALDLALLWAHRRQQFGHPLSSFQMIQQLLADMATKIEAARWLVYAAAAHIDEGREPPARLAAMAKCFASDMAMEVVTDAVQIFGGYGYTEDYPIARYFRDAKILQIYEGTNQMQRLTIARSLVKGVEELRHLETYLGDEGESEGDAEPPAQKATGASPPPGGQGEEDPP